MMGGINSKMNDANYNVESCIKFAVHGSSYNYESHSYMTATLKLLH